MTTAVFRKNRQSIANSKGVLVLARVDIEGADAPFCLCSDTVSVVSQGVTYLPFPFTFDLPGDVPGENPQTQLSMDNLGAEFMSEIEKILPGGKHYATVIITDRSTPNIHEWSCKMPVNNINATNETINASIGFDALYTRSAILLRHDEATSPGLQ